MSSQPPAPPGGMSSDVFAQLLAEKVAGKADATGAAADQPIIPLWKVRPASPVAKSTGSTGAGSSAAADRTYTPPTPTAGNVNPMWVTGKPATGNDYSTMAAAEGYWMDMSAEDRMAFADSAEKAGMWKKSLGSDALFQAWAKAVGWAGKYNTLHSDDKSKWLSPFEAVTNLAISGLADGNQSHDGFSTEQTVQQFSMQQIQQQARSILQQELGRNPTGSEMKAYTAAVNAAARANPQTVTQQQVDNGDGSTSTNRVVNGGIDPNEIIQGMAQGSQESADYKTAAQYLPALQQAIGAAIHM